MSNQKNLELIEMFERLRGTDVRDWMGITIGELRYAC